MNYLNSAFIVQFYGILMSSPPAAVKKREYHLKYEVDMLIEIARRSIYNKEQWDDSESNAHCESFLVHVRNITYFLFGPYRNDDICPLHFCSNYNSVQDPHIAGEKESDFVGRINKQIDHLTTNRTIPPNRNWNVNGISCDLLRYLLNFLKEADRMDKSYRDKLTSEVNDFLNKECGNNIQSQVSMSTVTVSGTIATPYHPD